MTVKNLIEKYEGKVEKINMRLASMERRFEGVEVPDHLRNMYSELNYEKEMLEEFIADLKTV